MLDSRKSQTPSKLAKLFGGKSTSFPFVSYVFMKRLSCVDTKVCFVDASPLWRPTERSTKRLAEALSVTYGYREEKVVTRETCKLSSVSLISRFLYIIRTSLNVHAITKWFDRSSYINSTFERSTFMPLCRKEKQNERIFLCFGHFWFRGFQAFLSLRFYFNFMSRITKEILIGRAQRRKQHQKYFYNFNFYGLVRSLYGAARQRQWKSDCSRWTTESNWQLLNQSCDDDFCNKNEK